MKLMKSMEEFLAFRGKAFMSFMRFMVICFSSRPGYIRRSSTGAPTLTPSRSAARDAFDAHSS